MVTDKGEFKFLHSSDYWSLLQQGLVLYEQGDPIPTTRIPDGGRVYLIVSDYQEKGAGLQDQPDPGTIKSFIRHSGAMGLPLPWESTITYDRPTWGNSVNYD